MPQTFEPKRRSQLFDGKIKPWSLRLLDGSTSVNKGWISEMFERNLPMSGSETVTAPFSQSPVLHSAITEFAECVAPLKLRIYSEDPVSNPDATEITDKKITRLFERPNPWQTWSKFAYAGVVHRKTSGEDLWVMLKGDGTPIDPVGQADRIPLGPSGLAGFWPVSGDNLELQTDAGGLPAMWRYRMSGSQGYTEVPYWSAIHFADYHPDQPFRGLGAAEVVAADLHVEWQAYRYQAALMENGGDPGGVLQVEGDPPSPEIREATQAAADQEFRSENVGRTKVVYGKGVAYKHNPISPKDMNYGELFKHTRDRQASAVGVPLPAIGYLENATYNNIKEAHKEKWRKVVAYLMSVEEVINSALLPRLRGQGVGSLFARFDLSKVEALKEDQSDRLEKAKATSIDTGLSYNESMALHGIDADPLPGGDVRLASGNVQLMETVEAGPVRPTEPDPASEEPPIEEPPEEPAEEPAEEPEGEKAAGVQTKDAEEFEQRAFDDRRAYWKQHSDEVLTPASETLEAIASRLIKSYTKATLKRLQAYAKHGSEQLSNGGPVALKGVTKDIFLHSGEIKPAHLAGITPELEEWAAKFIDGMGGTIEDTALRSIRILAMEMGTPAISLDSILVRELLDAQLAFMGNSVATTLGHDATAAIIRALDGTETVGTLQQIIADHMPDIEGGVRSTLADTHTRAQRIARTETGKAANTGRHQQMRHAGVKQTEWVSSNDEAVRDTPNGGHKHLDGKKTDMGQAYTGANGATIPGLTHPHAHGAPAAQVINCRCADRPVPIDPQEGSAND